MTMVIRRDSDRHERRRSRNLGVLLALILLVALVFAVTTVKLGPNAANPSVGKTWGTSLVEWLQGDSPDSSRGGQGIVAPDGGLPDEGAGPSDIAPGTEPSEAGPDQSTPDGAVPSGDSITPDEAAPGTSAPAGAKTERSSDGMMPDNASSADDALAGTGATGEAGNGSGNERVPE